MPENVPENPRENPAQLLPLALSRPGDALLAAKSLLASRPDAYDASLAHQAIGIVLRDRGDLPGALAELRTALRLAKGTGKPEREADVQASLGATLAWAGRSQQGLALLDRAMQASRGGAAGRVLMRRGGILHDLGRFREAYQDLCRALPYLRRAGDTVWEARTLSWRALVLLALGLPRRASADIVRAEALFAVNGQEFEYAMARHNLGLAALGGGDLPQALTYLDEAGTRYAALGVTKPDLAIDRCGALLAAGLTAEAAQETDAALSQVGTAYKQAELVFSAATAALAAGDTARATELARRARRRFQAQARPLWQARAELVLAEARYAAGERSVRLFRDAEHAAARLDAARSGEAMRAHLLTGRIALSRGQSAEADPHLDRAARFRHRGPPLNRSVAWLARALQAEARGSPRATVAACGRGLDALAEHQMTLGATELRAHGTAHGAELAALAQRDALTRGDARRLLLWSERWRATTMAARQRDAPVRHDRELAGELEALRSVTRLLGADEMAAARRSALERDRRRLEAAVQARSRRLPGTPALQAGEFDLGVTLDELGDSRLIELVEVDGTLYAIVAGNRRVRLHTVGGVPDREVQLNRFLLRRIAHNAARPGDRELLAGRGAMLESALLGPAAADLGDGPVVIVPPGRLRAVPWTLMPSLRDRVVTVAPSAAAWVRARREPPPSQHRVALIVGPELATQGAEVATLESGYPDSVLLGHGTATAKRVLRALDGAWLAHVAAHGTFRADNPLFSSIRLDDGPLIVHDLERLSRAPYRMVLSSCDSGVAAPVGADELLGLVSTLVPLGAAGIVASIVPVNDLAVVPVMLALHDELRRGAAPPEALLAARRAASGDPLAEATAHSFLALGA